MLNRYIEIDKIRLYSSMHKHRSLKLKGEHTWGNLFDSNRLDKPVHSFGRNH